MFSYFADPNYWMGLLYSIPAVLLALSVHEAAHAYAAYKCGDPTARNLGRMTMDPLKHLDPIGTICLLLFHFGWAKPVPVNSRNFKHPRRDNVLVSLSGIIANMILSFVAYAIFHIVSYGFGFRNVIFQNIMSYIILLNITLAVFNILPIPPLDGFQVLSSFLPYKAQGVVNVLQRYGFIILLILIVTGVTGLILGTFSDWLILNYMRFFNLFIPIF
ncbi:site-2 protease family protein [Christensenella timonensis]|uniref:site-2 protease family protein n=1 Tax=Christensenella timonensis TaxID=1816678 RepID=UPI00082B3905|nr:site-2 protease family protein [Christensenella timonensis]